VPGRVEAVRGLEEVDPERIAIWAFSAGGMLMASWLAESPDWLRCLALTYPVLATPEPRPMPADAVRPGRPLVLTRVGLERPDWQASVDRFLATAANTGTAVHVIDVPNGHHGFDGLDHTEESRQAVLEATDFVVDNLRS
jgi:acetyl esterase/lipase